MNSLVLEILSFFRIPEINYFIMLSFFLDRLDYFKLFLLKEIIALINLLSAMAPYYMTTKIDLTSSYFFPINHDLLLISLSLLLIRSEKPSLYFLSKMKVISYWLNITLRPSM
jgi:hypothetical protein